MKDQEPWTQEEIDEYVAWLRTRCQSLFEGCMCGEPKDHEGLCRCISDECDETWVKAQADEWLKKMMEREGR